MVETLFSHSQAPFAVALAVPSTKQEGQPLKYNLHLNISRDLDPQSTLTVGVIRYGGLGKRKELEGF